MRGAGLAGGRARAPSRFPATRRRPADDVRGDLHDARRAGLDAAGADPPPRCPRRRRRGPRGAAGSPRRGRRRAGRIGELEREEWSATTPRAACGRSTVPPPAAGLTRGDGEGDGEDTSIASKYQKMVRLVLDAHAPGLVRSCATPGHISNEACTGSSARSTSRMAPGDLNRAARQSPGVGRLCRTNGRPAEATMQTEATTMQTKINPSATPPPPGRRTPRLDPSSHEDRARARPAPIRGDGRRDAPRHVRPRGRARGAAGAAESTSPVEKKEPELLLSAWRSR